MTDTIKRTPSSSGLKSECLPFGEVLAQSIANIAPSATPTINIALVYASAGNATWLAYVIATVGLVFVSFNINQFASRSASPGSLYFYIAKGLGMTAGVVCGWSLVLAYLLTAMAVVCGFASYGDVLFSLIGLKIAPIFLFAICAGIAWYVAYRDIQLSVVMMLVIEVVSVSLILILGLITWGHKGFAIPTEQLTLQAASLDKVAVGLVLAIFSFVGFESATALGDEAKNPLKTIPNSVILSTILAGVFFIAMSLVEILGFSGAPKPLNETEAPLSFLASQSGVGFLGLIISVGAMVSFFACCLASINAGARIFFAMARHGIFHNSIGQAHGTNKTPHVAVTIASILAFLIPASLSMFGIKTLDILAYTGTIGTYGFLLPYILVSIAAPLYLKKRRELGFKDIIFAVLAVGFMIIPVIGSTGLPGSSIFPVPPSPYNVFPFLFLLYLIVGAGWFIMLRLRSPEIIDEMEREMEAVHTRFEDMKKV